jgi:hypothetical protein
VLALSAVDEHFLKALRVECPGYPTATADIGRTSANGRKVDIVNKRPGEDDVAVDPYFGKRRLEFVDDLGGMRNAA